MWFRILLATLCLIIICLGVYVLWPTTGIGDLVNSDEAGLIVINKPLDLIFKLADSNLAAVISNSKAGDSVTDLLRDFRENREGLVPMQILGVKVYISVPKDLLKKTNEPLPFTTYLDLGRELRVAKIMQIEKMLAKSESSARYNGVNFFTSKGAAMAFLGTFVVVGRQDNVLKAIDTYKGKRQSINDVGVSLDLASVSIDQAADISYVLFSNSVLNLLSKVSSQKLGFLVNEKAFDIGYGKVSFETDAVVAEATIAHKQGKVLLPHTSDKYGPFTAHDFITDDQLLAVTARLESPDSITDNLLEIFSQGRPALNNLAQKLSRLIIGKFLAGIGPQMGYYMPMADDPESQVPIFALEISNRELITEGLAKSKSAMSDQIEDLKEFIGPAALRVIKTPEKVKAKIDALQDEQKAKATEIYEGILSYYESRKIRGEMELFDRIMYYEFVDDFLVLCESPTLLAKAKSAYSGKDKGGLAKAALSFVDADGAITAVVDVYGLAKQKNQIPNEDFDKMLKESSWKAAFSAKGDLTKTTFRAGIPMDLGVNMQQAPTPTGMMILYYAAIVFGVVLLILAVIGLIWIIRIFIQG